MLLSTLSAFPENVEGGVEKLLEIGKGQERPSRLDVVEVPQEHVDKCCGQAHVRGDEVADVCSSQMWDAIGNEGSTVDFVISGEEGCEVVFHE